MDDDIYQMIDDNNIDGIRRTLSNNSSLAIANAGFEQPIHAAATNNRHEIVDLMLDFGADVNAQDEDGLTPLHRAAESGPETVRVLLKHQADPNVFDSLGYTAMSRAIRAQTSEGQAVVALLRHAGAYYGLPEAAALGDLDSVKRIICNKKSAIGELPSSEALISLTCGVAYFGNPSDREEIIRLLIDNGLAVPVESLNRHAHVCSSLGWEAIARLLREHARKSASS
jgi:hypothetical protein